MSFDPAGFAGLTPRNILVVGVGHQREQIKDAVIARTGAVAGKWIFTPDQLALEILRGEGLAPGVISPAGRQEFYRLLFSNRAVLSRYPALKQLKRQDGFFRRLDQAVLASREAIAHEQEREVLEERLLALELGSAATRAEIGGIAGALDAWLEAQQLADAPRLFRLAIPVLSAARSSGTLPAALRGREGLFRFRVQDPQSLEALFFDELSALLPVREGSELFSAPAGNAAAEWSWRRSHTLQDSAELLVSELLERDWSRQVILIPDTAPEVRLVLRRALRDAGIPEFDPRDPQELRLSESFKRLFLVVECVASRWDPPLAMALLALPVFGIDRPRLAGLQKKLSELGQRPGLALLLRALGDRLPSAVAARLSECEERFGRRLDFHRLRDAHLSWCDGGVVDARVRSWLERFWGDFGEDLGRLGLTESRFPAALWMERIRGRLELATPPTSSVKPASGVRIFRMSQANAVHSGFDLWMLGLPASWLSPPSEADFFLGSRERDQLGLEFQVRSARSVREARKRALESWTARAASIGVLDQAYHLDGSESESVEALLGELGAPEGLECRKLGAHPRFLPSYGLVRRAMPPLVELEAAPPGAELRVSATALDAMSRCAYLGLVQARWRLSEREEADWELWPRVRGVLYHRAAERMVREIEQGGGGEPSLPSRVWTAVWEEALAAAEVPGWIRSPQLEVQIERQALVILSKFLEKELEYRRRSGVRCVATEEEARLSLSWEDAKSRRLEVVGKADRIDEHPEGLFVLDYKTGGQAFKGGDIRERGYHLQLPFYALAARARFGKPVLGVQLVELTREARRSVGLFPKRLNGKDDGMLTQLGKTNSGLFDGDPDALWSALDERIRQVTLEYADGRFEARPVMGPIKECRDCRARLVCGQARREWVLDAESGDSTEEGAGE